MLIVVQLWIVEQLWTLQPCFQSVPNLLHDIVHVVHDGDDDGDDVGDDDDVPNDGDNMNDVSYGIDAFDHHHRDRKQPGSLPDGSFG